MAMKRKNKHAVGAFFDFMSICIHSVKCVRYTAILDLLFELCYNISCTGFAQVMYRLCTGYVQVM